jgi:peptidyl-prolyl cis-trans isomerase C
MQIDLQRQAVLINAYLQDYIKANPVTDDAIRKEYERVKESAGAREYKVRHILVETEDEGKQLIAQIKKGGSFEKLAGEKSKDQGSKGRGGDLDWATPARYVPEFGKAITKLKKGQMTDAPVKSQFGWHVIRVDDERPAKLPSFEEVKPQIEQQLRQQTVNKVFTDLRAKAKIE